MTPSRDTFLRLLGTLEQFAAQESIELVGGNYSSVRQIQERAAPVVAELFRLGPQTVAATLRPRLDALMALRRRNGEVLSQQIWHVRKALTQTQVNLRTVGQIAPVYGRQTQGDGLRLQGGTRAVA
ncbi:MAG: hypothetical protein ABI222_11090 [Opitutaceae bacterium]